mmetsp:Transcript_10213/g.24547  ORF Transcript_10213/g.24547 Transcript_10213/m.24547 type:complete len:99 (-) Transcript_10213:159-455(-)
MLEIFVNPLFANKYPSQTPSTVLLVPETVASMFGAGDSDTAGGSQRQNNSSNWRFVNDERYSTTIFSVLLIVVVVSTSQLPMELKPIDDDVNDDGSWW